MYKFWYDYMKPKYNDNVKLCYTDTDSFIMNIKTEDFYKDIANDVEKMFDTSNYEVNRPLPTGKNKNVIRLMKDELGGRTIMEFVTLRPKTYSYLTVDCKEDKKAIDDLEGYFDFSHNLGYLNLLFDDDNEQNKYYQVWKEIINTINEGHGKIRFVSSKWKINDTKYKYFCGYLNDNVIQPLCVILPQMSGYIKYFDDGGKNMLFVTDDKEVYEKYNEIWNVVKKLLKLKFTVRDDKYILSKLKVFMKINLTIFTDNAIPIEKNHYICLPAIDIDSVLKVDKKAYPQAYLEQCKYKLKKRKAINHIDVEIIDDDTDDSYDSDNENENDFITSHLDNHKNALEILLRLFRKF